MEYNHIVFRNINLSAQQIFRKSGNFVGNKQMGKGPYGLFLFFKVSYNPQMLSI